MSFAKAIVSLGFVISIVAHAAPEIQLPAWVKFPLSSDSALKTDIYTHSIADSVFIELGHKGFLPPIQHIGRDLEQDSNKQIEALILEIEHNLAIDKPKPPTRLRAGSFKGGSKRDLDGRFAEFQSSDQDGINYITCVAFLKDGKKLHAVYIESFLTSLPKCSDELIRLARDPVFLR